MKSLALTKRQRAIVLGCVALAALLGCVLLARRTQSPLGHPDPVGPTVYSKSAIGHAAFFNMLDDLDIPVTTSEGGSGFHLAPESVLLIGEPRTDSGTLNEVNAMLGGEAVLLVLPKRSGKADGKRPNWLGRDELLALGDVKRVLGLVDPSAALLRLDHSPSGFASELDGGRPQVQSVQLIRSHLIRPLVAYTEGTLVGEYVHGTRKTVVLADPDLISNFGLRQGANATLAVHMVEHLRAGRSGEVVFDEFIHGFADRPFHFLGILFQFPFVLVSVQMALAVALLLWAASARFGSPPDLQPDVAAGQSSLLESGARLLDQPGQTSHLTQLYFDALVREAAFQARAPKGLETVELLKWFSEMGRARGIPQLPERRDEGTALLTAQATFEWKKGMRDES